MHRDKRLFFLLNLVGGIAVLGGYAYGIWTHFGEGHRLWGGIPEAIRPTYTTCMFPAAVGYLVSFAYLMRVDWAELRIGSKPARNRLFVLHSIFLTTAAMWMPMTWHALDHGVPSLFWPIQVVLLVTGLSSLAIAWTYRQLTEPPRPTWARRCFWALLFLVWQCLILDSIVWPRFFEISSN